MTDELTVEEMLAGVESLLTPEQRRARHKAKWREVVERSRAKVEAGKRMTIDQRRDRAAAMVALRATGESYRKIGKRHNLSTQRVMTILRNAKRAVAA